MTVTNHGFPVNSELPQKEPSQHDVNQLALKAVNLGKTYHLYSTPSDRLKQILFGKKKQYFKEFTALKEVSFDLPKGEVLGLIGRNGAGKSTLLQLICGTLTASHGELQVNGRIAALLELGAGFNPQFTGRENIYLSATVMGISRQEIDQKIEDIIDFSGIRPFIEQPVSTYSSGMFVRLAFSVATSVDPDILVIDEALSVGDGDFARRSFERIMAMKEAGKTILFCSHSLYQIEVLCSQAIWIEKGQVQARGLPSVVVPEYQGFLDRLGDSEEQSKAIERSNKAEALSNQEEIEKPPATKGFLDGVSLDNSPLDSSPLDNAPLDKVSLDTVPLDKVSLNESENSPNKEALKQSEEPKHNKSGSGARITKVTGFSELKEESGKIKSETGKALNLISRKSKVTIEVEFQSYLVDETPQVALAIHSAGGQLITSCGCWVDGVTPKMDESGKGIIRIHYENMPLFKGTYYIGVLLFCERGLFLHDEADPAVTLYVTQPNQERGVVYIPHQWDANSKGVNPVLVKGDVAESSSNIEISMSSPVSRWRVDDAANIPQGEFFALFQRCFGHELTLEQWSWKYRYTESPGVAVLEQDRVVAFNGGMPRQGLLFGESREFVQMGDIMVEPESRGILTKRGPFYLSVQSYLQNYIGEGKRYSHGFGFPNKRAFLVGEKQGLYCSVDSILEPHWPMRYQPTDSGLVDDCGWLGEATKLELEPVVWGNDPRENANTHHKIDQLWQAMSESLSHVAVGHRDSKWLQYRYHDKPNGNYKVYWVKQKISSEKKPSNESECITLGLIVIKHHLNQGVELLDFLCEQANAGYMVYAAQLLAGRLAESLTSEFDVFSWMTPSVLEWLSETNPIIQPTPVTIPGCGIDRMDHAMQVQGKWWLMGGDSDFR